MRVIDLKKKYPKIYRMALANQLAQGNDYNENIDIDDDNTVGNFFWEDSSEGFAFWDHIYKEQFFEAQTICPELFIPDDTQIKAKEI